MSEISLFPNGSRVMEITPEPEITSDTPPAHLDVERGVFITSKGNEITLSGKNISALMLERITNEGRPKIPMVEVTLLGKHKQLQANPLEPGYLSLLQEWQNEQNIRVMRYMFNVGAAGTPPQSFVDEQIQFLPNATDAEMKYMWVASLLPDEDIDKFTEAIMGRGLTTVKGLEEAANFSASE